MTDRERETEVARYVTKIQEVFGTGAATPETSHYPALTELLNAVGATLSPRRFVVSQLANRGAGFPDYGVFAEGEAAGTPPSTVLEMKPFGDPTLQTAASPQVTRYADAYGAVLVSNYHQFLLVAKDEHGEPRVEQLYSLAGSPDLLLDADPGRLARDRASGLFAYLSLALSRTATIRSGAVLATVLASHARECSRPSGEHPGVGSLAAAGHA